MNFCPWVRQQNANGKEDRYTWRHNGILSVLINHIAKYIKKRKKWTKSNNTIKKITFVKSGWRARSTSPTVQRYGILAQSKDWQLCFDLPEYTGKGYPFVMPQNIVISPLKPDLLIISNSLKYVIFCELTCPNEENLIKWQTKKYDKYSSLIRSLNTGWKGMVTTLEVGTKGFVMQTHFINLPMLWASHQLSQHN